MSSPPRFKTLNAAAADYEHDVEVEAKTYNDRNWYVLLHVKGKSVALEPDWAREIADQLHDAADEAETAER